MRVRFSQIMIFSLTILFSMSVAAQCLLSSYHATYSFFGKKMKLLGTHEATLDLPTAHSFVLSGQSNLHVLWFKEHTESTVKGTYGDNKLIPKSYYFHETRKNTTVSFAVPAGKYDPISFILNVRLALLAHANKAAGSASLVSFPLQLDAKGTTVNAHFNLDKLATTTLSTALGRVKTVVISHTDNKNFRTQYWLAPKYAYLPVQLAGYKQGEMIFMDKIKSYEPANSVYCVYKGS